MYWSFLIADDTQEASNSGSGNLDSYKNENHSYKERSVSNFSDDDKDISDQDLEFDHSSRKTVSNMENKSQTAQKSLQCEFCEKIFSIPIT